MVSSTKNIQYCPNLFRYPLPKASMKNQFEIASKRRTLQVFASLLNKQKFHDPLQDLHKIMNPLQVIPAHSQPSIYFNPDHNFDNFIDCLIMRSSFCLDSVSSARQINLSPLNNSSSKHLFSFSKDMRFKQNPAYCDSIYNIPSTFRKSGAGIGYGKKSDFTKDLTVSPGSSKYDIKTIFDRNKSSSKGFSLYLSRDKIPDKGHIALDPLKVPAPNKYDTNKYDNLKLSRAPTFTMRRRLPVIDRTMSIQPQNANPGAGRYENPESLSPRGRYSVSKHKGTGATLFNPKRSVRFFEFKNVNPGPGMYEEINTLSDRGHYSVAKSHGFGKRIFDKEQRVAIFQHKAIKNKNPGPGAYRAPSDFGHYDGEVYSKTGGISYLTANQSSKRASKVQLQ